MKTISSKRYYWNKIDIRKILPVIVSEIVKISNPEKIILFGSYAQKKENKDSDIDLIIVKNDIKSKHKEAIKIRKKIKNFIIPMDIIVVNSKDYKYYSENWMNSIFADAQRNGRILFERT